MKRTYWWQLTSEEADRLNPPVLDIVQDDDTGKLFQEYLADGRWLAMGYVPMPRNRFEWFLNSLYHGFAMRYPWWKVIGFAFACKPGPDIDLSELAAEYENYLSWSAVEGHEYEPESFGRFVEWAQSGRSQTG